MVPRRAHGATPPPQVEGAYRNDPGGRYWSFYYHVQPVRGSGHGATTALLDKEVQLQVRLQPRTPHRPQPFCRSPA